LDKKEDIGKRKNKSNVLLGNSKKEKIQSDGYLNLFNTQFGLRG